MNESINAILESITQIEILIFYFQYKNKVLKILNKKSWMN